MLAVRIRNMDTQEFRRKISTCCTTTLGDLNFINSLQPRLSPTQQPKFSHVLPIRPQNCGVQAACLTGLTICMQAHAGPPLCIYITPACICATNHALAGKTPSTDNQDGPPPTCAFLRLNNRPLAQPTYSHTIASFAVCSRVLQPLIDTYRLGSASRALASTPKTQGLLHLPFCCHTLPLMLKLRVRWHLV
jgi:hypothetical protein